MKKDKKVVFITGCSSGLGSALVQRCLDLDYIVYATVRDIKRKGELEQIKEATGLYVLTLDVRDTDAVTNLVAKIQQKESHIDVLIVNAGSHFCEPVESITSAQIDHVFGSNFIGALNCVQAVLPIMRKQKCGNIIAVSSLSAQIGLPCDALYSASKAALERMLESLRAEVAPFGISVNAVVPSTFPSRLLLGVSSQPIDKKSSYYPLWVHSRNKLGEKPNGSIDSVVKVTVSLIGTTKSDFRVPADDMAMSVLKKIYRMEDVEREKAVSQWSDTVWWHKCH